MEKKQETRPLMKDINFLLTIEALIAPLKMLLVANNEDLSTYNILMEELQIRQKIALENDLFERN